MSTEVKTEDLYIGYPLAMAMVSGLCYILSSETVPDTAKTTQNPTASTPSSSSQAAGEAIELTSTQDRPTTELPLYQTTESQSSERQWTTADAIKSHALMIVYLSQPYLYFRLGRVASVAASEGFTVKVLRLAWMIFCGMLPFISFGWTYHTFEYAKYLDSKNPALAAATPKISGATPPQSQSTDNPELEAGLIDQALEDEPTDEKENLLRANESHGASGESSSNAVGERPAQDQPSPAGNDQRKAAPLSLEILSHITTLGVFSCLVPLGIVLFA